MSHTRNRLIPSEAAKRFQFLENNERRSSTDGLPAEEKQGIYQIDTGHDNMTNSSLHNSTSLEKISTTTATVTKEDIIPDAEEQERIELIGFALGLATLDNVPSALNVCQEKEKSLYEMPAWDRDSTALKKKMEDFIVDRVKSSEDILEDELQATDSQANMFY